VTRRFVTLATTLLLAACSSPAAKPQAGPSASPAPPTPTFTDVSHGDTNSIVKLLKYDPKARAAVVEPVVFLDGPAFCRAFRIPETDPRCEREWVTEDSRIKVTLPVTARVRLLTVKDGDASCVNEQTGAGSCPWSSRDLAQHAAPGRDLLVRLTTADGAATTIAELYLP
jgi:hypothetical protein